MRMGKIKRINNVAIWEVVALEWIKPINVTYTHILHASINVSVTIEKPMSLKSFFSDAYSYQRNSFFATLTLSLTHTQVFLPNGYI